VGRFDPTRLMTATPGSRQLAAIGERFRSEFGGGGVRTFFAP
jgi:hypothetical protein